MKYIIIVTFSIFFLGCVDYKGNPCLFNCPEVPSSPSSDQISNDLEIQPCEIDSIIVEKYNKKIDSLVYLFEPERSFDSLGLAKKILVSVLEIQKTETCLINQKSKLDNIKNLAQQEKNSMISLRSKLGNDEDINKRIKFYDEILALFK